MALWESDDERERRAQQLNKETEFFIEHGILKKCEIKSEHIVIPNGITEIAPGAFTFSEQKELLKKVEIPSSTKTIGERAFYGISNLASVEAEYSVEAVGLDAFEGTAWLKKQRQSNNFVSIGDVLISAYYDSFAVEAATYYIDENSGKKCTAESFSRISSHSFYQNDVKKIFVPDIVDTIDKHAFYDMGAEIIYFSGDFKAQNPIISNCNKLKKILLSEEISRIEANFVEDCPNLKTVYLESSRTAINKKAFPEGVEFKVVDPDDLEKYYDDDTGRYTT